MGSLKAQSENRAPTTSGKVVCMARLVLVHLSMVLNNCPDRITRYGRLAYPSSPLLPLLTKDLSSSLESIPSLSSNSRSRN